MFLTKRSKLSELQLVRKRVIISYLFFTLYNSAKPLKEFIDSCCLSSGDKLFHALTVDGRNELKYWLDLALIVCKSLEFRRL